MTDDPEFWDNHVLWRKIFLIGFILILVAIGFMLLQIWKYKGLIGEDPVPQALSLRFPNQHAQCQCSVTFKTENGYNATEFWWFNESASQRVKKFFDFENPTLE